MKIISIFYPVLIVGFLAGCKKGDKPNVPVIPPAFSFASLTVNGTFNGFNYTGISGSPVIKVGFSTGIDAASTAAAVALRTEGGALVPLTVSYEKNDSIIVLQPTAPLAFLNKYILQVSTALQSKVKGKLLSAVEVNFLTSIDSTDKFPRITDDALLTKVQQQTFKYFWDFGHPVSGMARERNSSGDLVTTGGTGFGIMAMIVAAERGFITRAQARERIQTITNFLATKSTRYHGAFAHWINGATGATMPFSANDNGGDLVETSLLMQGLLTARQYFSGAANGEPELRTQINTLWNAVEWNWYRQSDQQVLYWHWSPDKAWQMNHKIAGWNEALITYVLAASSTTHTIPATVYTQGWTRNGVMVNGKTFFGQALPLGPDRGGPLFFAHYSFLGINPNGLTDTYANYFTQNKNHSLINYGYCVANPASQVGYSNLCWGLTASDIPNGYTASSPTNDVGVISPTAAISSMPYTPVESMAALKFFYYTLGDKLWKEYGFVDAFHLGQRWFAESFLAIDQGPIIVMIENHRTGLLWNLFTSCPEVKAGMLKLGFAAPYL